MRNVSVTLRVLDLTHSYRSWLAAASSVGILVQVMCSKLGAGKRFKYMRERAAHELHGT